MCTHNMPKFNSAKFNVSIVQCPTAHELLQCSFIRGANETCGLEGVFDLYWKYKTRKDKQLRDKLNSALEVLEWNRDEE